MESNDLNASVKKELLQQPEVVNYAIEGRMVHVNLNISKLNQNFTNRIRTILNKNVPMYSVKFNPLKEEQPVTPPRPEELPMMSIDDVFKPTAQGKTSLVDEMPSDPHIISMKDGSREISIPGDTPTKNAS